jgi:hypothetical protein
MHHARMGQLVELASVSLVLHELQPLMQRITSRLGDAQLI